MKTIRVKRNIWGNYVCYVCNTRERDTGQEWVARQWLRDMLDTGLYKLSDKSDLQPHAE